MQVTPPLPVTVEVRILLPYDFKQTTLDGDKADVSVNIYAWLKAQETEKPVQLVCAIGDDTVDGTPYAEIVETARRYIQSLGGFENFAEWGLVR